ncbi:MAG: L,D-transpeptidase family protein, partial [Lachnospiraceae bacterium]|nr:L,D-transpeptidase family protein [Lachnospiraceae bacterium]
MRVRKLVCAVFLILCMALSMGLVVLAAEEPESGTGTEIPKSGVSVKVISGKSYLYDNATGKKCTGYSGIKEMPAGSGNYYYFYSSKSGRVYTSRWVKKSGKYYYPGKDGILLSKWQTIDKKVYYFSTKTRARITGWLKVKGKYYYLNSSGIRITKWLKLKKYTYYLDPSSNGVKTIGWKTLNGKTYYFNERGRLQTGWFTVNGKKYYSNTKGIRQTGLVTISGSKYYFSAKTGAVVTGWQTFSGKKYYFSKVSSRYGKAVTGWMSKGGSKYYFSSAGVMQTGWLTIGTSKYYLDTKTGKMYTGKHTIDGKTYDFGTSGAYVVEPTGAWSIKVNRVTNVVTIYRGTTPVKALTCSVGLYGATPLGTFSIQDKLRWHELNGPSWGQYCEHITWNILFHSVPCNRYRDPYSLPASAYNKLGSAASHGCIRLNVISAKYIYDNCPIGTRVTIFDGTSANDPLGKPYVKKIPL